MGTARFLLIGIVLVFAPLIGCSADRGLSTGQHHFFQKYKTKPHYRALSFTGSLLQCPLLGAKRTLAGA